MKVAARAPEKFAVGLAKALDGRAPFVHRPVGPDARMLLIANKIMPSVAMHHMIRVMMGIPRFGALSGDRVRSDGQPSS